LILNFMSILFTFIIKILLLANRKINILSHSLQEIQSDPLMATRMIAIPVYKKHVLNSHIALLILRLIGNTVQKL
jgi:hypothetical protein